MTTRAAVRFKDTPIQPKDSPVYQSSDPHGDLLMALQLDESSSVYSESVDNSDNMSQTERVGWVGRTPHAKVIEASRSRKAFQELTKMADFGPMPNSSMMEATPYRDNSKIEQQQNITPQSDLSESPQSQNATYHAERTMHTPYAIARDNSSAFEQSNIGVGLTTPFLQNSSPTSDGTPSSACSFDLLNAESERILLAMPNQGLTSGRKGNTPSMEYSLNVSHPTLGSHTPGVTHISRISVETDDRSAAHVRPPLSTRSSVRINNRLSPNKVNQFEKPRQFFNQTPIATKESVVEKVVETSVTKPTESSATTTLGTPRQQKSALKPASAAKTMTSPKAVNNNTYTSFVAVEKENMSNTETKTKAVTPKSLAKTQTNVSFEKPKSVTKLQAKFEEAVQENVTRSIFDLPATNDTPVNIHLVPPPEPVHMQSQMMPMVEKPFSAVETFAHHPVLGHASRARTHFVQQEAMAPVRQIEPVTVNYMAQIAHPVMDFHPYPGADGVSMGKGPIFACMKAKKVDYNTQVLTQQAEQKERINPAVPLQMPTLVVDAPKHLTAPTNSLQLAKVWATPRNTRKPIPHNSIVHESSHMQAVNLRSASMDSSSAPMTAPTSMDVHTIAQSPVLIQQFIQEHSEYIAPKEFNFASSPEYKNHHQDVSIQVESAMFSRKRPEHNVVSAETHTANISTQVSNVQQVVDESSYALEDLLPKYASNQNSRIYSHSRASTPLASSYQAFDTKSCTVKSTATQMHLDTSANNTSCNRSVGVLGSASRVPVREIHQFIEQQWDNFPLDYINEYTDNDEDFGEAQEDSEEDQPQAGLDYTVLTDIAVAHFTHDAVMDDDATAYSAITTGADTTFTLDQSFMTKSTMTSMDPINIPEQNYPRLAIKSLKRAENNPLDIKEINFDTVPGEYTTVMLTFSNHRPKELTLKSDSVLLRIEPTYNARLRGDHHSLMPSEAGKYFNVSPAHVVIPPRGEGMIFITFSPEADKEGIYSGAMRIKCGKKSYTILLRGESNLSEAVTAVPAAVQQIVEAPVSIESPVLSSSNKASSCITPASVFQNKLKVLHDKIAEISKRVFDNDQDEVASVTTAASTHSQQVSEKQAVLVNKKKAMKTTANQTELMAFPQTLMLSSFDTDAPVSVSNSSARPKIVRISSNMPQIKFSSSLATIVAQSQYRFTVRVERLTSEHIANLGLDVKRINRQELYHLGMVTLQYDDGKNIAIPVSVSGSMLKQCLLTAHKSPSFAAGNKSRSVLASAQRPERSEYYYGDMEKTAHHTTMNTTINSFQSGSVLHPADHQPQQSNTYVEKSHTSQRFTHSEVHMKEEVATAQLPEPIAHTNVLVPHKSGLYFRKSLAQFGSVALGNLVRTKIELCNATNKEVVIYLGDLNAPFAIIHNEVRMRPRSYVRVPVRFIPTYPGEYAAELIAQFEDGSQTATIKLAGFAYA